MMRGRGAVPCRPHKPKTLVRIQPHAMLVWQIPSKTTAYNSGAVCRWSTLDIKKSNVRF